MNIKLLRISLALLAFLPSALVWAQLGEGGTPASFSFSVEKQKSITVPVMQMPALDMEALRAEDAINDSYKLPYRFGYNHLVNVTTSNQGAWERLSNGDGVWRIEFDCPGAQTINLSFAGFKLPKGGRLYVYNPDHSQVFGAFTSMHNFEDQMFGTDLMITDKIIVEYDEPAAVAGQAAFTIFRVTQGYRSIDYAKAFGMAGSCQNNVKCPGGTIWSNERRGVVCLVSSGNEFCSGSLVNNTANDGTPYILTANHCGPVNGAWVFRFNWESPNCNNPTSSPPTTQSISGAIPIASNANSDFILCKMSSVPPASYTVFYEGWSLMGVIVDSATGIHHPSGDIKKISWARNPTQDAGYQNEGNGAADCWRVGTWTSGCTEPGSSGSPLFDPQHHIIGQLYGGPSACGQPPSNMFDYYGKFSASWGFGTTAATRLKDWLDPLNLNPTTWNGYDPNGLGIKSLSPETISMNVFPNPSQGAFEIDFGDAVPKDFNLMVYNVLGAKVWEKNFAGPISGPLHTDLGNLSDGIYLLVLRSDEESGSRKISIRH